MSIRTALSSLPSWPALAIAPVIILAVGYMSYGPSYRECTRLAEARSGFTAAVERAAQAGRGLALEQEIAAGDWDQVRILQGVKPSTGPLLDCPFGWDLSEIERRGMIAKGELGILAFAKAGEVVTFVEFSAGQVRFEDYKEVITRADAVFAVEAPGGAGGVFTLRPAGAGS